MAATDSLDGHPTTFQHPVLLYGLVAVLGARWYESTAWGKDPGNRVLINFNKEERDSGHAAR